MKVRDIINEEATTTSATTSGAFSRTHSPFKSVQSIGDIQYKKKPHKIEIYKFNENNEACCVANIKRTRGEGWKFRTTKEWNKQGLPHFGQLHEIKPNKRGSKTISSNIHEILNGWGIRYDKINEYNDGV